MRIQTLEDDELADFRETILRHKQVPAHFALFERPAATPAPGIHAVVGILEVKHRITAARRSYSVGSGSSWLAAFELDLVNRVFG
jgi:hypothetical protein